VQNAISASTSAPQEGQVIDDAAGTDAAGAGLAETGVPQEVQKAESGASISPHTEQVISSDEGAGE